MTKAGKGDKRKKVVDEDDMPIVQTKTAKKALLAAGLAGSAIGKAAQAPAGKISVEGNKEKSNDQRDKEHDTAADVVIVALVDAAVEAPSTKKRKTVPKVQVTPKVSCVVFHSSIQLFFVLY